MRFYKYFFVGLAMVPLLLPQFSFAQSIPQSPTPCAKGSTCLENPLGSKVAASEIIGIIIQGALGIVGALTLLMLVVGGFHWLTSAGNSEKIEKGTKTMIWAVIGLFLVFASYLILTTFTNLLIRGS